MQSLMDMFGRWTSSGNRVKHGSEHSEREDGNGNVLRGCTFNCGVKQTKEYFHDYFMSKIISDDKKIIQLYSIHDFEGKMLSIMVGPVFMTWNCIGAWVVDETMYLREFTLSRECDNNYDNIEDKIRDKEDLIKLLSLQMNGREDNIMMLKARIEEHRKGIEHLNNMKLVKSELIGSMDLRKAESHRILRELFTEMERCYNTMTSRENVLESIHGVLKNKIEMK